MYVQMSDTWDNYYFRVSGKTIIIIINTNIIITTIIFIPEYGRGGLPWWLGNEVSATQEKQEMGVRSLGWEDPLEKSTATHSSILARKVPWTEKPGKLLYMGLQRIGHDWSNWASRHGRGRQVSLKASWPAGIFPAQPSPKDVALGGMQVLISHQLALSVCKAHACSCQPHSPSNHYSPKS